MSDPREHWQYCWMSPAHMDCLRTARDTVDCDMAVGLASRSALVTHLVGCPHPVHRWDCAWQLKAHADNAEARLADARETHARSSYAHRRLMHRLDRLLQDTKGRKTVPRDEVQAAWREALS